LYRIHLKAVQEWCNARYTIFGCINQELVKKYKTIEIKLQTLVRTQIKQPENKNRFYPRFINKNDTEFTNDELTLLNNFLKYNPNHNQENRIKTLALEADTAITQLPTHEQDHIRYEVAHNITRPYKPQEQKHTNKATHIKIRKIP
jgi:hypothetical protein